MFTPKIKDWKEITYTDGSLIKHKDDDSPTLSGLGVYKPGRDTSPPSQDLQLHMKPNGCGPTSTINRAELADIFVALQQGQTDIASDSASCLSQIFEQTSNSMRMRYHLHAELIRALSTIIEHSSHPIHFYKVKAHSGIIGNEGADACACTAALTDTTDIVLPDAKDLFHNNYWLSLKTCNAQNGGRQRSHAFPTHYLNSHSVLFLAVKLRFLEASEMCDLSLLLLMQ
eukprot:1143234-Pelagomonas_calceolata.AAC.1